MTTEDYQSRYFVDQAGVTAEPDIIKIKEDKTEKELAELDIECHKKADRRDIPVGTKVLRKFFRSKGLTVEKGENEEEANSNWRDHL